MKKLILSLLVITIALTGCGKKNDNNDTKKSNNSNKQELVENKNPEVVSDKVVDGIELKNTSLTYKDGISTVITAVTNNTDSDYRLDEYTIIARDIHGVEVARFPGYVGNIIMAGETRLINSSIDIDLSEAGSIEYEVKKLES